MTRHENATQSSKPGFDHDDESSGPPDLLLRLERMPKIAIFLAVLVVTMGILWIPGPIGAVLTLLLAAAAAYLLYATWPNQAATASRVARVLVVLALLALGIGKFLV